MLIHKITPFLSDIKDFFNNSDMTATALSFKIALHSQRLCYFIVVTMPILPPQFPIFADATKETSDTDSKTSSF